MKTAKAIFLVLVSLSLFFVVGCSSAVDDDPDELAGPISGLIYEWESNRILVVDGISSVNIPRQLWFENGHRAVSFAITEDTVIEINGESVTADSLARGQAVEVWHEGSLAESYPEQGGALKVVIVNPEAASEATTDSGRYIGVMTGESGDFVEIKITGVPDEIPSRLYQLTEEAWAIFNQLNLASEDVILFRYLPDSDSDGLIFDLSSIEN